MQPGGPFFAPPSPPDPDELEVAVMTVRMPLAWIAISLLLSAASPLLAAAPEPGKGGARKLFPYAIAESVLENGLRVVVVPMDSPGIVAHYVVVRAGSRNEKR